METQLTTSLNAQESFNAILASKEPLEIITTFIKGSIPPLWPISEHFAVQTFGASETVIRYLSFFFFLVSIFFVYKIGALFSKKTGVFAASLTFLNPFLFQYAFEGQAYSLLTACISASMFFFLKILRGEGHPKLITQVGYVLATIFGLYSHQLAFWAVFVQFIWILFEFIFGNRDIAIASFKLFVAVGIGYIPWIIPIYNQIRIIEGTEAVQIVTSEDLRIRMYEYLFRGNNQLNFSIPYLNLRLDDFALYCIGATLLLRKWHKGVKKSLFIVSWSVIPILGTWVVSQNLVSIFNNNYLLYVIPSAMLILGSNTRKFSYITIALTLILFAIIDIHYFTHPKKLPFEELAAYIHEETIPTDAFINWNGNTHHLWETKYYGIKAPIFSPNIQELPSSVGTALMDPEDVIKELPNAPRIGVITSGQVEKVELPFHTLTEKKEFQEAKVLWFEKE